MDFKTFINKCKEIITRYRNKGQYVLKSELVEYCKEQLNKSGFWVNFEGKKDRYPWRINLTYRNNQPSISEPFNVYCNGTVIGIVETYRMGRPFLELKVASVPIPTIASFTKDSLLNTEHDVYKLTDGTTVNLYYWEGKWTLSSTKAYDMNSYSWRGVEWMEALEESLEHQGVSFSFDKLDKNKSYTIMFRNPQLHPFNPEYSVKFIASCNLKTLEFCYDEDIGIPIQQKVEISIDDIYEKNKNAYSNWQESGEIDYGYSVLIKSGINAGNMAVLPSTLLSRINCLLYKSDSSNKDYMSDINFVILNAIVNNNSEEFKVLFPTYSYEIEVITKSLGDIVDIICDKKDDTQWKLGLTKSIVDKMKLNAADPDQLKSTTPLEKRILVNSFVFNSINLFDYYNCVHRLLTGDNTSGKKSWADMAA
jgi:hypothetical protein